MVSFHPLIGEWFERKFGVPTPAQAEGWPAIAGGRHTLISAPTGSGKTLAAFLICIDRLLCAALEGGLPDEAQVVYVSPLKALSNDIEKNLSAPLAEIALLAKESGTEMPELRVAVRTGDTPAHERRRRALKPPHIWITTPESLYILLTSVSGRRSLEGVRTLILDEIHAVAPNKRGSHLALSVERLCALARGPVTRIGLSATQHPIEEIARLLVGAERIQPDGTPDCRIVDVGRGRKIDLQIEMPADELGAVASHELWDETVARIADLVLKHRTTIVFVNTRRLVERVAHQLSERIGAGQVVAHHGSLSRKTRLDAEERLKSARVKVCVATASLELGLDVGAVELVCQIGSPRSIGVLLQRVGRSGHWLGGTPKGRLFPLTRDELIECGALLTASRSGELDRLTIPAWPLDILSQQIVAMCAAGDWNVEELFRLVRRAWPYRDLPRKRFDGVIDMLSSGVAPRLGYRSAWLHHDRIHGTLRGRRGARLAALTNGGAIPDNADYDVIADPDGTFVGKVTEDFAVESVGGDVFLLGNASWKIRRVERGKVRVEDAQGQTPSIPFWLGEAPSRTFELSRSVSRLRCEVERRLDDPNACRTWLIEEAGLPPAGAGQAMAYISDGRRILGAAPTMERLIAERFFDESGGMQIVLHSCWGGRINRAWGLALRKRFCRSFDFELQASATDDGICLSLGAQHSFPLEEIFQFLKARNLREDLTQALLASPVFTTRWRWVLNRALALPRFSGGRRVPPQIQRMRAEDLMSAVFPAQTQCQDNRAGGDIPVPDHPLLFETLRDCLTEALDLEGLKGVLQSLERGGIELIARDTPVPSPFSHQILNAMPYAFLDDAPLEERRARAVILRRALPENAAELGRLNPEAIRGAAEDAWPEIRNIEELHDMLLGLVVFPEGEIHRLPAEAEAWFRELEAGGRAFRAPSQAGHYWIAAERLPAALKIPALRGAAAPAAFPVPAKAFLEDPGENALDVAVRGWVEVSGPFTAAGLAGTLRFPEDDVYASLIRLEAGGLVLRGSFTGAAHPEEFCDRRILARIHRATIARLRREIEPVAPSDFITFLFSWQHVAAGSRLEGEAGVLEAIEQLQGFETSAGAWEEDILPARVSDYNPLYLDNLCLAGDVAWGRWTRRTTQAEVPARRPGLNRAATLGLAVREDLGWLLEDASPDETGLSVPARRVLDYLRRRGASFFPEIVSATRHLPSEVEDALWQLAASGLVTADSFAALRALVTGEARRLEHSRSRRKPPRRTREGRWSLLDMPAGGEVNRTLEFRTRQYLRRYGIMLRELLAREISAPPWRDILPILRRMEARGEIRGGRFAAGFAGEQFALPEAVDSLRSVRREKREGRFVRLSACDPLNLAGILTPGPRVASVSGNRIVYRDGVPAAAVESGEVRILVQVETAEHDIIERLLDPRPASAFPGGTRDPRFEIRG